MKGFLVFNLILLMARGSAGVRLLRLLVAVLVCVVLFVAHVLYHGATPHTPSATVRSPAHVLRRRGKTLRVER